VDKSIPYHINSNSAAGQGWKSFPKDNANPPTGLRNSEYHTFYKTGPFYNNTLF